MKSNLLLRQSPSGFHPCAPILVSLLVLAGCGGGGDSASTPSPSEGTQTPVTTAPDNTETGSRPTTPGESVDNGTTTPTDNTTGGGSTTDPVTNVPVATVPFSCATDAITCVEVASTSTQAQASVPVTFGQVFKAGDWKQASQGLIAKVDGAAVPLQADEVALHADGSARFAVLSVQLNNLPSGQARIVNLYAGTKSSNTPNVPADPNWNLELEAQVYDDAGNLKATLSALPQAQLKTQIAQGTGRRLAGAVASEYTVVTGFTDKASGQVHPHLTARLHTRLVDAGARIRTDVVMENTRTWTKDPGNIRYSFSIKRQGTTLFTQPQFTHNHHARWHQVVWTGSSAQPAARVRHNMPYVVASKAVWNYNLSLQIPESVLAEQYAQLVQKRKEQSALGPMGNALLTPYFPTTGGRAEIGPLPTWTALYLLTQDARSREVMLANADAAAAVPVHYRDEGSSQPLDLDKYPNVSVLRGTSQPALPTLVNGTTIWEPDTSHQASYAYVPYLVTGDAFYLDELMFWAAWNLTAMSPGYRSYGQGLLWEDQVRGQAWTMRALGEAARITPQGHPMKAYFQQRLSNNLDWYHQNWVLTPLKDVSPMGTPVNPYDVDTTAPWQNDFYAIVMAQLAENGESKALDILTWASRFNVGRFLNEAQGICLAKAAAYYLPLRDANKAFTTNWSDFAKSAFPGVTCSASLAYDGYPEWAGGYAANARAMLATSASLGMSGADQAYKLWVSKTPKMDKDFANNPTWALVPRP